MDSEWARRRNLDLLLYRNAELDFAVFCAANPDVTQMMPVDVCGQYSMP